MGIYDLCQNMTQPNQPVENKPITPPEIKRPTESPIQSPEQNFEFGKEKEKSKLEIKSDNFLEDAISGLKIKLRSSKKKQTVIPTVRDALSVEVEKVMEEGLKDAFKEMTPIQQQEFKIRGEETALQIRDLLRAAHIQVKKIFRLIASWLKMIPGINRFFLEQEAKIKTDKILALKKIHDSKQK